MCEARAETRNDDLNGEQPSLSRNQNAIASDEFSSKWPEDPDSDKSWLCQVYQRWTYSYMNKILKKGSQQTLDDGTHLEQQDLYAAPESMKSDLLSVKFREYYGVYKDSKRRLIATLWRLAAPTFIPAGFCQLIVVVCQVAMPLLVRQLLTVLEMHPNQKVVSEGMPYAIGIFLTLFVNAFGNHRHRHLAMKSGIVMRAATINILYEHALTLTPRGRADLTSGEVSNLIAVDTQKLYEVAQEGHLIWALPLSIILVTICLLLILGPTALVGVGILIMFVPIVERITSRYLKIRQERVKMTDKRVQIITDMLQGIKVAKLNNYEECYEKRVTEARDEELRYLHKELAVWASTLFMTVLSPVVATAATFSVYVLVDENNILTAAMSFSVLLLFAALRFPINFAGRLIGRAAQALSAVRRITRFLAREVRMDELSHLMQETASVPDECVKEVSASEQEPPLTLAKASFLVGNNFEPTEYNNKMTDVADGCFTVSEFNFSVGKGEVLAVAGPVGSGKSSLVNGIIDEIPVASAESLVSMSPNVAFVPQNPFILNATLRENILFGLPFDQEVYDRVLDVCCLKQDIQQLGRGGDLTEIGERGVTLSGGQKQRVSLARAAYSRPDLVLADDPISALDAGTAKTVFERLIKSPKAFFSDTAVVLVTHASHFLNRVDAILVMVDCQNKFLGTWADLAMFEPSDPKTKSAIDFIRSSVQEGHDAEHSDAVAADYEISSETDLEPGKVMKEETLMTIEQREHGLSSLRTWFLWFKYAGGIYYVGFMALFMALDRVAYVALEYWLARWCEGAYASITVFGVEFPPQSEGRSSQYRYLSVYALILAVSVFATFLRSEWSVTGGSRAAKRVFCTMLASVLRAPLSYFETTPMGRVLNRFTYDMEVVDVVLTQNMSMFLISSGWYITGVVVMSTILPWLLLAIIPVSLIYWLLLLRYRKSGPDLQRLDAVSRSPIQAMVTEGLDGASTIRIYRKEHWFLKNFRGFVDLNTSALLNFVTAQRWLGVRIEVLGSLVVLASSVLVVCLNDVWKLDPGIVGLLLIWSSNFTITLAFLVDTFGEAEAAITAIERVDAMRTLPKERPMKTDKEHLVPASWPEKGRLEFKQVNLRYRDGLPLALNHCSFELPAGKSCGVVGRTGAGKSSLTVALFRLVEIENGTITLDGIDLAGLGLSDVRGRRNGLTIIPQDPFLTGATLRECLDPFGKNTDKEIAEALGAVGLGVDSDGRAALYAPVQEGGSNFSVGEKQLLNLARALLSKPKLLVLDEATASIDGETDNKIQKMLRTRFSDTTLLTVAHRLNTIMDYQLVLVMDEGKAVELGPPGHLLEQNGLFADLVNATGPESAKALRSMVNQDLSSS